MNKKSNRLIATLITFALVATVGTSCAQTNDSEFGDLELARVNGDVNICPTIDYMTAKPLTQSIGKAISFISESSDFDAESISVHWSAVPTNNSFDDPNAANTNYNCQFAGEYVITLTVTDDHDISCSSTATFTVYCGTTFECGNGITEPGERCDDGNLTSGDGCSDECRAEYCGDGVVQQRLGEQCEPPDRGNCNDICHTVDCGNGAVDPGETCDDNNLVDCDGCSSVCQVEVCGNNVTECTEECDDGNTVEGDGCENDCTVYPRLQ